jgi:predicted DCC family thiol-disulfide oxidoreductase YuxK
MENFQNLLLFDGVCNLCNGFVQFVIKHDRKQKFKFAALQSNTGQKYLKRFNLENVDFESFVYIKNDQFYQKSTAAILVLKDLGFLWKLSYLLFVFPKFIRDAVYSLLAKNRYKLFGKKESCMLPTPELKNRFLN